jgi:nicotinate-nucleotide adenylyltransferase
MPIAVIDRPDWTLKASRSRMAVALAPFRVKEEDAATIATSTPPAWLFMHGPRSKLSSTELRRKKRTSPRTER